MVNQKDTVPQGDPDTVVLLPDGALVGLYIRGLTNGHVMLGIREDAEGRPMSCAVTNAIYIDTARPKMDMTLLSNPRRPQHGYGAVGDDE